jgi:hypothetical protein
LRLTFDDGETVSIHPDSIFEVGCWPK